MHTTPAAPTDAFAREGDRAFMSLNEGDVDPSLNKRIAVLIAKHPHYIVYLDGDGYVEWATNAALKWPDDAGPVLSRVSLLEATPLTHLDPEMVRSFRRMVGEGVARLFDSSVPGTEALKALETAEQWIAARNGEIARGWIVRSANTLGVAALCLAAQTWLFRDFLQRALTPAGLHLLLAFWLGGVGAWLSILIRTKALELDPVAGERLHVLESVSRIAVGGISAMLLALALKANLVAGGLGGATTSGAMLAALSMVAGASERLVPGFVDKIAITPTLK